MSHRADLTAAADTAPPCAEERAAAARLRMVLDAKLGRDTPAALRRLATRTVETEEERR